MKSPGIVCHSSPLRRPKARRGRSGKGGEAEISGYKLGVCRVGLCDHSWIVVMRKRASRHSKIHCLRKGLRFLSVGKKSNGFLVGVFFVPGGTSPEQGLNIIKK